MKKSFLVLILSLLFIANLFAQRDTTKEKSNIPFMIGFSWVPSNSWGVYSIIGQKQYLKYDFDANSMTTWEGSISGKRFPIKIGVNAQFEDNLVGKLYKLSGYLGFKRMFIRVQSGKLSGNARWTGGAIPNYETPFSFSYRYTNIDLLRSMGKNRMGAGYIGLGYTSMKVPIQVNTLITNSDKAHQEYGTPVFDREFTIKAYSFLFGFDLMQSEAIAKKFDMARSKKSGFGFFVATYDKVGLGMSYLTDEAIAKAEEVNKDKKSVGGDLFSALVEYQLSMGPKWSTNIGPARFIVGLGYEFSGAMVGNFSGAAKKTTDLGYDPSLFYYRHGVILRAFFSW